jgi:hypothetical protein
MERYWQFSSQPSSGELGFLLFYLGSESNHMLWAGGY